MLYPEEMIASILHHDPTDPKYVAFEKCLNGKKDALKKELVACISNKACVTDYQNFSKCGGADECNKPADFNAD
jgi:hypothetical protein